MNPFKQYTAKISGHGRDGELITGYPVISTGRFSPKPCLFVPSSDLEEPNETFVIDIDTLKPVQEANTEQQADIQKVIERLQSVVSQVRLKPISQSMADHLSSASNSVIKELKTANDNIERHELMAKALYEEINSLKGDLDVKISINETLGRSIERLKDILHIDQTGLAKGLSEISKTVNGWRWATEARGPYEYNDNKFFEEMKFMLDAVEDIAKKSLNESGSIAHAECCGKEKRKTVIDSLQERLDESVKIMGEMALKNFKVSIKNHQLTEQLDNLFNRNTDLQKEFETYKRNNPAKDK